MVDEKIEEQGQVYLTYKEKFINYCKSSNIINLHSYLGEKLPKFLKQDEDCCASFLVGPVRNFSKGCSGESKYYTFVKTNRHSKLPLVFDELIYKTFDKELIESKEVALKANTLQFASEQHKKNMGLCLMLAEQKCKDVTKYMDESLKKKENLILDIVEFEPANIVYTEFRNDTRFVANSIVRNLSVLQYLKNIELLKEVYEMFLAESRVPEECIKYLEQRIRELTPKVEKKTDSRARPIKTISPKTPGPSPRPRVRVAEKGLDGRTHIRTLP